ncbi:hypothetical protein EJ110_NYTH15835, partial [Nymphaea thermarum]
FGIHSENPFNRRTCSDSSLSPKKEGPAPKRLEQKGATLPGSYWRRRGKRVYSAVPSFALMGLARAAFGFLSISRRRRGGDSRGVENLGERDYCLREVKWNSIEVNWHCESCCLKCSEITPSIYKQDLVANQVKQDNAMGTSRLLANVKQSSVANMNMVRKFGSKRRRRRLVLEDEDVDEDVVPREAGLNVDENKNREVQTNWNDQNLANLEPDVDYAHGVKKLDMRGCTFPESSSRDVNNDLVQSLGLEGNWKLLYSRIPVFMKDITYGGFSRIGQAMDCLILMEICEKEEPACTHRITCLEK